MLFAERSGPLPWGAHERAPTGQERARTGQPGPSHSGPNLAPDDGVDRIAALLEQRTGLRFDTARRPQLERAAAAWLDEFGPAPAAFAEVSAPGSPAWRRLVSLVTVGETYFFRHAEQLEAFRELALTPLVQSRQDRSGPSLRVWSAGCSTGEEAYTLAILVAEALRDPLRWDVRVVGTDIDEAALEHARRGTYGRWSFRVPGEYQARWFVPTGGGRRVHTALSALVSFEAHNLADARVPLPAALTGSADAIVCRNVTIYMGQETVRGIVDRLFEALAPGGWLLVGPVEPSPDLYRRFVAHQRDGFTLYQRPLDGAPSIAAEAPAQPAASEPARTATMRPPAPWGRPYESRPPAVAAVRLATAAVPSVRLATVAGAGDLLLQARRLADTGDLAAAEQACHRALALDRRAAGGYALLAAVADAREDLDGACDALGRAIYLRPDDPLLQFRLGLLEWRRGRTSRARARLRAAEALLDGRPDAMLLDEGEGLTVGRVRSAIVTLEA